MQRQAEECTNFPPGGWLGSRLQACAPVVELDGGQRATLEQKNSDWLVGDEECAELRRAEPTTPHPPTTRWHVMSAEDAEKPTFFPRGGGGSTFSS